MLYRADSDTPEVRKLELGSSQRFVPGGMFLGWLIENDGAGERVSAAHRSDFLTRRVTGATVFAQVGGVLDDSTIGPSFRDFAAEYIHRDDGGLFRDMAEWFPVPSVFDVRDTWHNYEWMRIRLVERYSEWRSRPTW